MTANNYRIDTIPVQHGAYYVKGYIGHSEKPCIIVSTLSGGVIALSSELPQDIQDAQEMVACYQAALDRYQEVVIGLGYQTDKDAETQGKEAYYSGLLLSDNPFRNLPDKTKKASWAVGWKNAKSESIEMIADKFIQAGKGLCDINERDLSIIGLTLPESFVSVTGITIAISGWESLCRFVYEQLTGNPHPDTGFKAHNTRNRRFAQVCAKAIRDNASNMVADS